ncbi:MAG: FAD-dependent oxidoreductase [Desulfobacter sp.]|nr:MAG: FAD-dependent oxidoreductase [Desulfobacter sp.]
MEKNQSVIVIGGGVIGLACAHYLMKQGARVTIIEKNTAGSGSSHGNCGLLYFTDVIPLCAPGAVSHEIYRTLLGTSPLYIKPGMDIERMLWLVKFALNCRIGHMNQAATAKYELLKYSSKLFTALLKNKNFPCDFEQKGILSVFKEEKNLESFEKTNNFLQKFNLGYKRLGKKDTLDLEPALSPEIAGAWYSDQDHHLRPEHFVRSWKTMLVNQGLTLIEECEVIDICINKRSIRHVSTSRGNLFADAFVLAAGAWSPLIASSLNLTLPVQPGKGYSITMERPDPCPNIPCMLCEKNMVVTPWKTGYRLGGTMEFSGYSDHLNSKRLKKLIQGAKEYMSAPCGHPIIKEWTGLRPMTYDDMPIIGRSPFQDNLVIATGHGMLGLTLATGTGKLVSDMIFEKKTQIDTEPYLPGRF